MATKEESQLGIAMALRKRDAGNHSEALGILDGLLAEDGGLGAGEIFHYRGTILQQQGRYREALKALWIALEIRERSNDRVGVAFTSFQIAMCRRAERGVKNNPPLASFRRAEEYLHAVLHFGGVPRKQEGDLAQNLAFCRQVLGEFQAALVCYEEVMKIRVEVGDTRGQGLTLARMAECKFALNRPDGAETDNRTALAIFRELGDKARIAQCEELQRNLDAIEKPL